MWKRIIVLLAAAVMADCFCRIGAKAEENGVTCGAWLVYWDQKSGLEEAAALTPLPERLIAFEALFDTDGSVILVPEAEELLLEMQLTFPEERIILSVVNDLTLEEGGYAQKDRGLLRDLLLQPERRTAHVRELVDLAERWQLKGLEIDYENIHEDRELWSGYMAFLQELYDELQMRGISLRSCLEWDSILYTELPEGPEYSIMCYSLFGYHSGPGPKADGAFLRTVAELYQGRKDICMALATGGYDWNGDSVERELSEKEAVKAFRSRNLKPARDPDSGVLYGSYVQNGETHTVWYADAETLRGWMEIMQEYGFRDFDFFRLGGNTEEEWNQEILSLQAGAEKEGE